MEHIAGGRPLIGPAPLGPVLDLADLGMPLSGALPSVTCSSDVSVVHLTVGGSPCRLTHSPPNLFVSFLRPPDPMSRVLETCETACLVQSRCGGCGGCGVDDNRRPGLSDTSFILCDRVCRCCCVVRLCGARASGTIDPTPGGWTVTGRHVVHAPTQPPPASQHLCVVVLRQ